MTLTRTAHGLSTPRDEHWDLKVPCRSDPELMWPHPNAPIEEARRVCAGCNHTEACIEQGIGMRDWHSVRGGYSGLERERYHRQGLAVADYPPPPKVPIARAVIKFCNRCGSGFAADPAHPFARICFKCSHRAPQVRACAGCGKEKRIRSRGMCENCYRNARLHNELHLHPRADEVVS